MTTISCVSIIRRVINNKSESKVSYKQEDTLMLTIWSCLKYSMQQTASNIEQKQSTLQKHHK